MGDGSDCWDVVIQQDTNRIDVACTDEASANALIHALEAYGEARVKDDETVPY